jgi:WD40 repeat protein
LWDLTSRRVRGVLEGHERGVIALAVAPDGRTVASGGFDRTLRIGDVETGESRLLAGELDGVVTGLSFSPDGTRLAAAGEWGAIGLWDPATGEETARLNGFRGRVRAVAFSPDGTRLAAVGGVFENGPKARGEVKVWDLATRREIPGFEGAGLPVLALGFSPDGASLAAGGVDQALRVWNVKDGRRRLVVEGLPGCVQALQFSRDGRRLAWSGHNGGLVALHDVATGAEVSRLVGHTGTVIGIAFAPDGSGLATTSADRTIKLWQVPAAATGVASTRD